MTIFLRIRYYKCYITIELIYKKELILLKVMEIKNACFATTSFLIMDSNFKILYAMVGMILSVNISDVAIITIKNVDYQCIITLGNLRQLIY